MLLESHSWTILTPALKMINRFERKYIIDLATYKAIQAYLKHFVDPDKHTGTFGKYHVMSIYYDTDDYHSFTEKIDGEKIRKKFRIRVYKEFGSDKVSKKFYEIKNRNNQIVFKERSSFLEMKNIKPKILIHYIRQPLVSRSTPTVRITFDSCLKYRTNDLRLIAKNTDNYFIKPNFFIMEIKYNKVFPRWISYMIKKHNLSVRTYSKYCNGLIDSFQRIEKFI